MFNPQNILSICVRTARENKNLTQQQLAENLSIGLRTISEIENGKGNPKFETLVSLVHYLDIPCNDLFFPSPAENGSVAADTMEQLQIGFFNLIRSCSYEELLLLKGICEGSLKVLHDHKAIPIGTLNTNT